VCKHIVHLAREVLPLGEHRGLRLCFAISIDLEQQRLGLFLALA